MDVDMICSMYSWVGATEGHFNFLWCSTVFCCSNSLISSVLLLLSISSISFMCTSLIFKFLVNICFFSQSLLSDFEADIFFHQENFIEFGVLLQFQYDFTACATL
jgi:hypothetical protein